MDTAQPPLITAPAIPGVPSETARRRNAVTLKLLFIAALVLLLQLPLALINNLRQERSGNRADANARIEARGDISVRPYNPAVAAAEGYRMVERALKHSMLILTLTFAAYFLFETLAGLRLHAVHYGLVGAAMCLFYLALLAFGEILEPGTAYIFAALASSLLIVSYSASILRSWARASSIAALLTAEFGVLYIVLRMENYALLAGTTALFVILAALMYFTRNVDWFAQEAGKGGAGMKTVIESVRFSQELRGWALRGALCATVSFGWALVTGFNSPFEIAGMIAGVAAWVGLFAGYCAWQGLTSHGGGESFGRALKVAAWIKFGTSAAGGVLFLLMSLGPKDAIIDLGVVGVMPDCMLGLASIFFVSGISGLQMEALERADSFGWTALITFVDGALFLVVIGILALAVLLWWRFAPKLRVKLKLSPARLAG